MHHYLRELIEAFILAAIIASPFIIYFWRM
jgi:hypothetical protein